MAKHPPAKQPPAKPARRFRPGRLVRALLVVATVGACGALAYLPVTQYMELRGHLAEAEAETEANTEAKREAVNRLADSRRRNDERARCFNTWVGVGEETYVISGLLTCDD